MAEEIHVTNDEEAPKKPAAPRTFTVIGVTFRDNAKSYYFDPKGRLYRVGDKVIVDTARGAEFGTVSIANREVAETEIVSPLRPVLRAALKDDIARYEHNRKIEADAAAIFPKKAAEYSLEMKLADVECAFDNSKLIFYFTAENRVDFRELVRDLAGMFHTRIELRQIGIRDEAKMLGGIGPCGRPYCCSTFLTDFGQVSIKMAKEQNFSLNSTKISGCCGRLMCCLRYEHETYEEAQKTMPKMGALVMTENGPGTVVETRPLSQTVKVRLTEKQEPPKTYSVTDITPMKKPQGGKPAEKKPGEKKQGDKKPTAPGGTGNGDKE